MKFQVNTFQWLGLSRETRATIAATFDIPKRGHSVVHGGRVVSDGYRNEDLSSLTVEKMNAFLGTEYEESDVLKAFEALVQKIEGVDLSNPNTASKKKVEDKQDVQPTEKETEPVEGSDQGADENAGDTEVATSGEGESGEDAPSDIPTSPKKGSAKTPRVRKARAKS